ncbi:hypothetical protein COX05_02075 [candidate division WWE3 bacterium CG22_combo_CG10-13_8_21_14_all_39_12]|uniref:Uncharacterized protein n=2 Tax=Katanobacteria TaxID=422282 RepID=A0A2M7X044_UNCKA|nr:MAG: hypothetical protein COX05_02075 [candidate division WWE3 bacterium CG22_combo_CG10-13_8_21_14_all_39_12]PJA39196.1 MAG: hypothetical protein CO179_05700 [candidate division WWE3 bacterium CG_4_9_14_3_um_filter_39_7]
MFNKKPKPPQGRPNVSDLLPYDSLASNRGGPAQNIYLNRSENGDERKLGVGPNPMELMNNPAANDVSESKTMGDERKKLFGERDNEDSKDIEMKRPNRFTSKFWG